MMTYFTILFAAITVTYGISAFFFLLFVVLMIVASILGLIITAGKALVALFRKPDGVVRHG